MKYQVNSLQCGFDKVAWHWISIGYLTKKGEQRVLHIVAGEEPESKPIGRSLVPIYYEGANQSVSCYGDAESICVGDDSIILTLNRNGQTSLELPKRVEFLVEKPDRDFKKIVEAFSKFQTLHGGEVILFENQFQQSPPAPTRGYGEARRKNRAGSAGDGT